MTRSIASSKGTDPLAGFHPATRAWFEASFDEPTAAQAKAFPAIASGASTLLLAPTGSGKTLAAFLTAIDALLFRPREKTKENERLRVVYVSPLKALATDIERNLRAPIAGLLGAGKRLGLTIEPPSVHVRSGDTPARDRRDFSKRSADILITTPESLYLLLTSDAREMFRHVETVIVDEIHAVASTKRGSHLVLSLERLESERRIATPLQRIGLSATQRPLDVAAAFLGGMTPDGSPRPVTIVDAGTRRALEVSIEVPVEDMSRLVEKAKGDDGPRAEGSLSSIWPSIYPRLVELIRAHRTTLLFVNNRRLAERLALAINEIAEEELALAHHGSVAHEKRQIIEDRLKRGLIPAIVATSSLELGIDMGLIDLVIQIEAPPSVASGLQRIGRAGHNVGATSKGTIFPKFRADLLACAATLHAMKEGHVEETRVPDNALDVLAQQIVAMVSVEMLEENVLFQRVRAAYPYRALTENMFEGVLDMLSGRYPSDEFAELRPKIVWDRIAKTITGRSGSKRIAILSGGTIADRGLYGVFLASDDGKSRRVGELDEEMVFESRTGEVFLLGASSWRIEEITHDRVVVSPAPGEPGKMPFWKGDRVGRPAELGRRIGELARTLAAMPPKKAETLLSTEYDLDKKAARNLVEYIASEKEATGHVPTDRTIVVERFHDELGDVRVCVLSPFGAKVHAPWGMAVCAHLRETRGLDLDCIWSDDGIVFRFPDVEVFPDVRDLLPDADELEATLVRGLDQTALFAGRFRENAGRALLFPKKFPGKRQPLWAQRKRAHDLLAVASRYGSFPIVLETFRECLKDELDVAALATLLRAINQRSVRVEVIDVRTPSPFAASLLFSYVANFIYDGDTPIAERRAQALSLDQDRLRELLGTTDLRELLDRDAIDLVALEARGLTRDPLTTLDAVHDALLRYGDMSADELTERVRDATLATKLADELEKARRAAWVVVGSDPGERRLIAAEEAGRYRDALGVVSPRGLPSVFLEPSPDPLRNLLSRYARTHGPFTSAELTERYGVHEHVLREALVELEREGKLVRGGFYPGGTRSEWCERDVLRRIKQKSLARLRKEVEPVSTDVLARFLSGWHEILRPRVGLDALLGVLEQLEGCPLSVATMLDDVLPARLNGFRSLDLDHLAAAGEIVWRGIDTIGKTDGRIAIYLRDRYPGLAPPVETVDDPRAEALIELLSRRGAVFFADIARELGGYPQDVLDLLWKLVWAGRVTNDTFAPLRTLFHKIVAKKNGRERRIGEQFRSRRIAPPGSEGRWALLPLPDLRSTADRSVNLVKVLLERHGILARESLEVERIVGGFSSIYPVLKEMEGAGKVRRGHFVAGLGALQFALPGADERLRLMRDDRETAGVTLCLASTDPANPYGAILPWPEGPQRLQRTGGAHVFLHRGKLVAYLGRGDDALTTFVPVEDPERSEVVRALSLALVAWATTKHRSALSLRSIDGAPPARGLVWEGLTDAGFVPSGGELMWRRPRRSRDDDGEDDERRALDSAT